jgi:hypothetical protein
MFPHTISRPRFRVPRLARRLGVLAIILPAIAATILLLPGDAAAQESLTCGQVLGIGDPAQSCLRVVNAATDGGPIDVYLGDAVIAQQVDYGQATEFAAVPSGSQRLRVVAAGGPVDQAAIDMTQDLRAGNAYQLTVVGLTRDDVAPWLSGVAVAPLPENQARVRVVHASPDSGPIDVAVAGGPTPFAAIDLGSQSGYVIFGTGTVRFQLRLSGSDTLLLTTPDVEIEPGTNYDLYVIGESTAGTLELVIFTTEVGVATTATPETAAVITPIVAVASTPIVVTPGAETPEPTPTS